MAGRIKIDGIYRSATFTDAQITANRNLDSELFIKFDAVASRSALIPDVNDPTVDSSAYPSKYIMSFKYDSTQDGADNPNIRRHIPTLEFLGNSATDIAGANWINIETGTYNVLTGGETLQDALTLLDIAVFHP